MSENNGSIDKNLVWITLFVVCWATYILYPFKFTEPGISADGVTYIHIAKNIVLDGSLGWQATWAAPFFSVLMAALYPLVGNLAVAGVVVSKIMTALLPLAVYLLAKEIFNQKIAVFAAILTAFHPHFTFISGSLEPEMTYTTLLVFSLWAIWRAFTVQGAAISGQEQEVRSYISRLTSHDLYWAILAGILASLAYQTRSEGLLIFLFAMAALGIITAVVRRQLHLTSRVSRLTIVLVIVSSFILTSLPYLLFLKETYGKVVLSPKSAYVQIWMKPRIYKDGGYWSYYPPFLYSLSMFTSTEGGDIDLWGLTKEGRLKWQQPKGIGDLMSYLMSHPEKSIKVYLLNFSRQIPGRIPNNSGQWLYPQVYPWYFVIPALFWVVVSFRRKGDLEKMIFLLSPFVILFVLPIFSNGWWKYLLPYAPFLIILAVAGFSDICERVRWRYLLPAFAMIIAIYSLWTVKASPLVKHGDRSVIARGSMLEEQKKAGEWAQRRFKGTPNYMVQWSKLAYYLNGRWTAMPVTDYNEMIWYAKKNRADYLVFETSGRDESQEIVRIMGNTPDLEVADMYESTTASYGVVFLRLKK